MRNIPSTGKYLDIFKHIQLDFSSLTSSYGDIYVYIDKRERERERERERAELIGNQNVFDELLEILPTGNSSKPQRCCDATFFHLLS